MHMDTSQNLHSSSSSRYKHTLLGISVAGLALSCLLASSALADPPPQADLSHEKLGGVQLGDLFSVVTRQIGPPEEASKEMTDSVNECVKRIYFYRNGLEIETCKKQKREEVYSLRAVKSPKVETSRGIKTGSRSAEVRQRYPQHEQRSSTAILVSDDRENLKLRFLIGEDQKVYEISLYRDRAGQRRHQKSKPLLIKRRRNVFD